MVYPTLSCHHRDADIRLTYDSTGRAELWINGLVRDSGQTTTSLRLDSVVQTDYEFHEQVSARIQIEASAATLTLYMGHEAIASQTIILEHST